MSSRTFLYLWFPLSWVVASAIAGGVVWLLRESFLDVANRFGRALGTAMKVMFPAGIVLPTLAGFLSVSYFERGCGRYPNSQAVIADAAHLHDVAQREVGATAEWLIVALLVWAVFYTILVVIWKKSHSEVLPG